MPIDSIDQPEVMMCLAPIWTEKHETAKRLAHRRATGQIKCDPGVRHVPDAGHVDRQCIALPNTGDLNTIISFADIRLNETVVVVVNELDALKGDGGPDRRRRAGGRLYKTGLRKPLASEHPH
ncbi:hypothetical protein [Sulfitobacter sp. MF3-043]|uniref:hypothetical protein n=1 Tax=Sulfitobacter sediminivivens TaxID=3252902 RepID=UPI0036DE84D0